jgi:hypothetical protein
LGKPIRPIAIKWIWYKTEERDEMIEMTRRAYEIQMILENVSGFDSQDEFNKYLDRLSVMSDKTITKVYEAVVNHKFGIN